MTVKEYLDTENTYYHTKDNNIKKDCLNKIVTYNKELLDKYSWLRPTNRWTGEGTEDYDYTYTELDAMPSGWRLAFGEDICREIHLELVKYNFVDNYKILQIKEKYGSLRWYDGGTPIGKLSDTCVGINLCSGEHRSSYPEFNTPQYFWKEESVEHYISMFSEEAKTLKKEELEEYNSKAIYHYNVYEIVEKCRIPDIINKYEDISAKTCIICGSPAVWESKGWISPYCTTCAESFIKADETFEDRFFPLNDEIKY